jgi:hypothetical protein
LFESFFVEDFGFEPSESLSLFGDDFGLEKSDNVLPSEGMCRVVVNESLLLSALIPLIESMGALVTPHLHEKVTHILCILKYHDTINWEVSLSSDVFERQSLHEELKQRVGNKSRNITLVSPRWVKANWENAPCG